MLRHIPPLPEDATKQPAHISWGSVPKGIRRSLHALFSFRIKSAKYDFCNLLNAKDKVGQNYFVLLIGRFKSRFFFKISGMILESLDC